ncbi:Peptidase inhibitor I78 family protein [compost metagenome]
MTGRAGIDDAQAMQVTGASLVRQIKPGQGVTMDYRQERVTIETDPKTGNILRAFCG